MNRARRQQTARKTLTRNQILDAAIACFSEFGISETNIQLISQRAGAGRTTLYRYFDNQEQIMAHAIIRDIYDLIEQLDDVLQRFPDIEDKIIEGMMFCLTELPRRPVLAMFISQQTELINQLSLNEDEFNQLGARKSWPRAG